jgi:predicted transcriptional regulator
VKCVETDVICEEVKLDWIFDAHTQRIMGSGIIMILPEEKVQRAVSVMNVWQ